MSSRRAWRERVRPAAGKFVLGSFVRLVPDGPIHRVIWCGKQPMPRHSDWPGEMAVYRLDNDHWDCYYEYQLLAAQPWDTTTLTSPPGS